MNLHYKWRAAVPGRRAVRGGSRGRSPSRTKQARLATKGFGLGSLTRGGNSGILSDLFMRHTLSVLVDRHQYLTLVRAHGRLKPRVCRWERRKFASD